MTSCHAKLKTDKQKNDKRPNIISDYNLGVDRIKSSRYAMLMLHLIADMCINSSFILMSH
ncbi:hypothetical protein T4D_356 [Trichinella pseudospiralis]|uniref:PiggyBac transposable element-derived protein domain-containing protein n=1 Tax=Trichinella pseudospiralis TaxID=6337 RepID=A0A0V1F5G9_TRIPS|nr:hypothetical protein T4D_356 [Trichinella pseudospiralis]